MYKIEYIYCACCVNVINIILVVVKCCARPPTLPSPPRGRCCPTPSCSSKQTPPTFEALLLPFPHLALMTLQPVRNPCLLLSDPPVLLSGDQRVEVHPPHVSNRHQQLFGILHIPIFSASASSPAGGAGHHESQIQNLPHRRRTNSPHQQSASENEPEEEDQLPPPLNPKI